MAAGRCCRALPRRRQCLGIAPAFEEGAEGVQAIDGLRRFEQVPHALHACEAKAQPQQRMGFEWKDAGVGSAIVRNERGVVEALLRVRQNDAWVGVFVRAWGTVMRLREPVELTLAPGAWTVVP